MVAVAIRALSNRGVTKRGDLTVIGFAVCLYFLFMATTALIERGQLCSSMLWVGYFMVGVTVDTGWAFLALFFKLTVDAFFVQTQYPDVASAAGLVHIVGMHGGTGVAIAKHFVRTMTAHT